MMFPVTIFLTICTFVTSESRTHFADEQESDIQAIEEILSRHIEIPSDIESLSIKSSSSECIRQALKDIMPQCITLGIESIDPKLRKESALRLSICEFETSRIKYPKSCQDLVRESDFDKCIEDLEKTPQYWTTFSGNYRDINKICYEESLPYEKDQIISLYSNISKIYNKIYQDLKESYKNSQYVQDKLKEKFDDLLDIIKAMVNQQTKQQQEMNQDFHEYNDNFKIVLHNALVVLKDFSSNIDINLDEMMIHINYITSELIEISKGLNDSQFNKELSSLKGKVLDDFHNLSDESNKLLNSILSNLENFNIIAGEHEERSMEMSKSLKENEALSNNINRMLVNTNDQIQSQNRLIRSEFEFSIIHFSEFMDQQIQDVVALTNNQLEDYISNSLDDISSKIDEAKERLDKMNDDIENFSFKLNNVTIFIYEGLQLLTDNSIVDTVTSFMSIIYVLWGTIKQSITGFGYDLVKLGGSLVLGVFVIIFGVSFSLNKIYTISYAKPKPKSKTITSKILCRSVIAKLFVIITNIAFLISILCGTLLAVLVSQFIIHLKLYIENINSSTVDN